VSKDQALGALLFLVCTLLGVGYMAVLIFPNMVKSLLPWLPWSAAGIRFAAIGAVVLLAFLAVVLIGAWIGWTIATTPSPKSIEEEGKELQQTQKEKGVGSGS